MKTFLLLFLTLSCSHSRFKETFSYDYSPDRETVLVRRSKPGFGTPTATIDRKEFEEEFYYLFAPPCGPSTKEGLEELRRKPQKFSQGEIESRIHDLKFSFMKLDLLNKSLPDPLRIPAGMPELKDDFGPLDERCFTIKDELRKKTSVILAAMAGDWHPGQRIPMGRWLVTFFPQKKSSPAKDRAENFWIIRVSDVVSTLGDVPYFYHSLEHPVMLLSADHVGVFLRKYNRHHQTKWRLPNRDDWTRIAKVLPDACQSQYWVMDEEKYFFSPKCGRDSWKQKVPWISIRQILNLVVRD